MVSDRVTHKNIAEEVALSEEKKELLVHLSCFADNENDIRFAVEKFNEQNPSEPFSDIDNAVHTIKELIVNSKCDNRALVESTTLRECQWQLQEEQISSVSFSDLNSLITNSKEAKEQLHRFKKLFDDNRIEN